MPLLPGRFANKAQLLFLGLDRLEKDFQGLAKLRVFGTASSTTRGLLSVASSLLFEASCPYPRRGFLSLKKDG